MKKFLVIGFLLVASFKSEAQIPIISVITGAVKKIINALDLEVQRLQNQTIWLQNAQKLVENEMSKLKLGEIADWVEKQRKLYADYYDELWKVKQIIMDYDKIKRVIALQGKIFDQYKTAYALFQKDDHFSKEEIDYMYKVYSGIIEQSLKAAEQLLLVTSSAVTQMDDANRLDVIDYAFETMESIYNDLKKFNNQNIQVSLQRSIEKNDVESIKKLYGIK